jgi:hypothetical protein
MRHDAPVRVGHVGHDYRHVLKPDIGARAVTRIRAPHRIGELQQLDSLGAEPQQ